MTGVQSVEKPLSLSKNGCLALLALLVLHRAKLLASNQSILALGVAPRQVAGTPVPVFTPFPGKGGRGIGIINQKFISKTDFFYNLNPRRVTGVQLAEKAYSYKNMHCSIKT